MQHVYAPWRSAYFKEKDDECPFCLIAQHPLDDEANFVFYRDRYCYAVMNRYPYTPGHFLLIPHMHVDSPSALPQSEFLHISKLAQQSVALLEAFGAQGINMGMNINSVGGAGIPCHLHWHFVPRFVADTNFFTTICNSRTYGVDFHQVYCDITALAKRFFKE